MARTVPAVLSATIEDEWGIQASTDAYVQIDPATTIAQAQAFMVTYLNALDSSVSGHIIRNKLTIVPALPTDLKLTALAGSRVEQVGKVNFNSTGTSKAWALNLPSVDNADMTGDHLTLGTGPLAALLLLLTTVQTLIAFANDHSQEISAFKDAFISFNKKRKQLHRSSLVTS